MERKLATVRTITYLSPIEGADKIELAHIDGWQVVVQKGQYEEGDRCIYVEIDSLLPDKPVFEFMRDRKFRVRTIRLRGQLSQGIAFPMSILGSDSACEGEDVTDVLGITKYEKPIPACLAGQVKGNFPWFLVKTDEERLQNMVRVIDDCQGLRFVVTEKLDGTSMTCYIKDGEFGVCSRNMELKETEGNLYWMAAREGNIEQKLRLLGKNIAIQGELIGQGIQGNKYNFTVNKRKLFVFNLYDIDTGLYYTWEKMLLAIGEDFDIVPLIDNNFSMFDQTLESLLDYTNADSRLNLDTMREGIVFRADNYNGRVSFKVISNEFLLKYKE